MALLILSWTMIPFHSPSKKQKTLSQKIGVTGVSAKPSDRNPAAVQLPLLLLFSLLLFPLRRSQIHQEVLEPGEVAPIDFGEALVEWFFSPLMAFEQCFSKCLSWFFFSCWARVLSNVILLKAVGEWFFLLGKGAGFVVSAA